MGVIYEIPNPPKDKEAAQKLLDGKTGEKRIAMQKAVRESFAGLEEPEWLMGLVWEEGINDI